MLVVVARYCECAPNCTLKIIKMVNFMSCIFYQIFIPFPGICPTHKIWGLPALLLLSFFGWVKRSLRRGHWGTPRVIREIGEMGLGSMLRNSSHSYPAELLLPRSPGTGCCNLQCCYLNLELTLPQLPLP